MSHPWPARCPWYVYLVFFLCCFCAGMLVGWSKNFWNSVPFWVVIIKVSVIQAFLAFLAINWYRYFVLHSQEAENEGSSAVKFANGV